jgi:hypothetical protein
MKRDIVSALQQVDRRHIQLALLVLTLALFVLGAGAPSADGGV